MKARPLSDNSRGRCRLPPCLNANCAIPTVSVTSAAFVVVHCFHATMNRKKSSRIVDGLNQSRPITFKYVKSICRSWSDAVVLS